MSDLIKADPVVIYQITPDCLDELLDRAMNRVQRLHVVAPAANETDEIFDVAGAAHFLGLAKSSVYCNSDIPVMKQGKKNYYSKKDLIQWLRSGKRKTSSEIDSEVDQSIKKKMKHH